MNDRLRPRNSPSAKRPHVGRSRSWTNLPKATFSCTGHQGPDKAGSRHLPQMRRLACSFLEADIRHPNSINMLPASGLQNFCEKFRASPVVIRIDGLAGTGRFLVEHGVSVPLTWEQVFDIQSLAAPIQDFSSNIARRTDKCRSAAFACTAPRGSAERIFDHWPRYRFAHAP